VSNARARESGPSILAIRAAARPGFAIASINLRRRSGVRPRRRFEADGAGSKAMGSEDESLIGEPMTQERECRKVLFLF
jgi:hypothetical protein